MMKRISLLMLIISLSLATIFANSQKNYLPSSEEYRAVSNLCLIYGVAGPSNAFPISGEELLIALDRIDKKALSSDDREAYESLYKAISNESSEEFRFSSSMTISPEIYLQSAEDNSITHRDWINQYKDRMDAARISMNILVSDYIYGEFEAGIKEHFVDRTGSQFSKRFHYNIPILNGIEGMQKSIPDVAGITLGSEYSHLYIGRNRQAIGGGKSGNLMVGDNFYFQNFGKLSIHTSPFTYNLSITYFDRQKSTSIENYSKNSGRKAGTQLENFGYSGPQQIRIIHNYQMTFKDKLTLSLNFGNLFDTESALDLRMLNPFMFMHNLFNFTTYNNNEYNDGAKIEANNHFSLGISYVPRPSWSIYMELMVDQFQLPGESSSIGKEPPNAIGALINISNATKLQEGFLSSYAELVYTSPNLYLNEKYTDEDGSTVSHDKNSFDHYYWNQDLILGNSIWWGNDISYSGYIYGPDTILAELGSAYEKDSFSIGTKIRYMAHGEQGIRYRSNQNQTITHADSVWNLGLTGTVEHTFLIALDTSFEICDAIELYANLAHWEKMNYMNIEKERHSNTQLTVGAAIKVW